MVMKFTNNATSTLAAGINNAVTSLTVATGQGVLFPTLGAGDYFYCTLTNLAGTIEIIKVTARSGDVFTMTRAQDGTSATSWSIGDKVELRLVAASLNDIPKLDEANVFTQPQVVPSASLGTQSTNFGQTDGRYPVYVGDAGGTADALTATLASSPLTALYDGMIVTVDALTANLTTTPTFNLTLGSTVTGAHIITVLNNVALGVGAIAGLDHRLTLGYKLATTSWTLINPAAAAAPVPYSAIAGFIPSSIAGTSTTASFTISAGQATDSTQDAVITKTTTTSWAASNGNAINGTDAASSTLANSTTYHVYMCSGASGTGSFVSASLTPTFPTGYAVSSRRVFSLRTTAAGALIADTFVEVSGGAVRVFPLAQTLDISTTVQGATRILYTLSVPTGVKMEVLGRSSSVFGATQTTVIFQSPDETDVAPSARALTGWTGAPGFDYSPENAYLTFYPNWRKLTNTSAQIAARGNAAGIVLYWVTIEYTDARRA
jgi:hypothetical protein